MFASVETIKKERKKARKKEKRERKKERKRKKKVTGSCKYWNQRESSHVTNKNVRERKNNRMEELKT